MDRQVPNNKRQREAAMGDWPKMPGQFPGARSFPPLVQTSNVQWPDVRLAENTSMAPASPTANPEVEEFRKWRSGIDKSLADIHLKLDYLLSETQEFRAMEAHYKNLQESTPMGTNLSNSCHRLDLHQQTIVETVQKLDTTMKQVDDLTREVTHLRDGSEVTVSFRSSGRK
ncbi:hypothetical protein JMJ77_0012067 [Colletotrichum scovillei]|uniref:Uncharacterized protein n=1 Tax=Colletotrichum scovillei TaxID=1209932 RepID=A0A9P7QW37_9PEZI|nr:hypothetical protein JMJ77_0012067 [Colletotrichum scovillei]KAG7046353.1 hypothetical protein JMJ78_0011417 [Colletotrichum scovillei]KAG7063704.1 hypothetical protein JMJ76_0006163 [Colletotrichum scovillei]